MTWVLLCTILSLLGRGSLIPNVGTGCHQRQTIFRASTSFSLSSSKDSGSTTPRFGFREYWSTRSAALPWASKRKRQKTTRKDQQRKKHYQLMVGSAQLLRDTHGKKNAPTTRIRRPAYRSFPSQFPRMWDSRFFGSGRGDSEATHLRCLAPPIGTSIWYHANLYLQALGARWHVL